MYLIIMRHGEAQLEAKSDRDRELTENGQQQSIQSGKWLKALLQEQSISASIALVSPFVRAQQTYSEVSSVLPFKRSMTCSDIVPSAEPANALSYIDYLLSENPDTEAVLLVSHMPFVSYFVDFVCSAGRGALFSTGAVCVIDYDYERGHGQVINTFSPD